MTHPIIIVGAGGHAKAIADALLESGKHVLGFVDPDPNKYGASILGVPVLGTEEILSELQPSLVRLVNGVGGTRNSALRKTVQQRLELCGWVFSGVKHPSAVVSRHAQLAAGVQILPQAVIQAGATIGANTIVNSAAIVEHDVKVGAYVHIAPGATLCGNVTVGEESHIGARAIVRQNCALGHQTVVGAGALVLRDYPPRVTLIGIPARIMGN